MYFFVSGQVYSQMWLNLVHPRDNLPLFLDLTSSVFPFIFWISKFWRNVTQTNLAKLVEIHYTSKNKFQNFPRFCLCQKMAKTGPDKINLKKN